MNFSDSKKKLALAGALCGVIAAVLAYFGNPANMAICVACFIRDTAGALKMHQAAVVQLSLIHISYCYHGFFLLHQSHQ